MIFPTWYLELLKASSSAFNGSLYDFLFFLPILPCFFKIGKAIANAIAVAISTHPTTSPAILAGVQVSSAWGGGVGVYDYSIVMEVGILLLNTSS